MKIIFILLVFIIFPLLLSQKEEEHINENITLEPLEEVLLGDPANDVLEGVADFKDNEKSGKKTKSGPSEEFIEEWDKVMGGEFTPEDVQIFILEGKSEEVFEEIVELSPTETDGFKGAFFSQDENQELTLEIYEPSGNKIYSNKKDEGLFNVNCTHRGIYTLKFINPTSEPCKVTLAYHYFHELKELAGQHHISGIRNRLEEAKTGLNALIGEAKFADIQKNSRFEAVAKSSKRMFWFTFIETVVILTVALIQIHFIEKLLSQKVIV